MLLSFGRVASLLLDFPEYIVNSTFRKTLQAHEDKSEPNLTAKQKERVVIYF